MAATDKSEWILLDNDLTTRLAILPVGQSHLYFEINEPGSGELRIPLDATSAGLIESGMFCQCYYRGSSRGGFFIDNIKKTQADAGENGGRWLSVSGRGALALLDDAIIWDNGTTETTREFTSVTKASILKTLIDEAQARGALANLTYDFTASVDSASVAWTDSESYKLPVGTSLLDVARQFAKTGGFDYEMNLVAGNFVLSAYSAGLGTDKSETIYMRTGINCEEVSTDERGDGINNALRVKYKAGYLTVSDSTSITNRRRREKLLSLEQAQTSASATTYASAKITQTKDPKTSIALRVYDGISPRLFEDYVMGDYVMTDVLGTEVSYRVLGIQADFDGADYSHVVLELNTLLYDNEMEMSQELDWLMDQWNTANDANELETSFWAALGTRAATGINDMLIYNGYLYICGSGQMAAGGFSGVARYEIATGIWSAMGSGFTDECTALVQMGGDIYVGVTDAADGCTVWKWNGSAWSNYYGIGAPGNVGMTFTQLITDGSDIFMAGTMFSAMDDQPVLYHYIAATTNVNTRDIYAFTYSGSAGTCNTIAFYGGVLYTGWSATGNDVLMKAIAYSGSHIYTLHELDPVVAGISGKYVTKLLEFGSYLLIAYRDNATGIAYLGQWNGTTLTLLGTFTNAGNNAIIDSITTYLTDIYVGGNFDTVDGVADMNRVAKYSGGAWSPLTNGVGAGNVYAAALNDLDLYVAGTFNTVDGTLKPADGLGIYFTNFESALNFASHNTNTNWGDIGGTLADQADLQAALDAKIAGTGVVGRVAEFVTDTKTIQAAKIIGPAANILTLTNAAAATLALNITAAKTLTLTTTDNYTLTIPATGTAALMTFENVGTLNADVFDFDTSSATEGWLSQNGSKILHTYGVKNLYLGLLSGNVTETGLIGRNVTVGYDNLSAITTGYQNTMLGTGCGALIQDGLGNVGLGTFTLTTLVSGNYNMAIGYFALHDVTSSNNIGIGSEAGRRISSGASNTIIGTSAGPKITTTSSNTMIGAVAGLNTTGKENTFIGANAGNTNVAGERNLYLGKNAGYSGSGSNNVSLGYQAGYWETGSKKLFIAYDELGASEAASREASFIYGDMGLGSTNRLQLNVGTTTTNAVLPAMKIQGRVSTAATGAANGFGTAYDLFAETATDGTYQQLAQIAASWIDATNATRKAKLSLSAYDTAARLGMEIEASGTAVKLGFFGVATVVRPTALTTQLTTITATAPGTPDYAIQDMVAGGFGFVTADEAQSTLKVILNLQTRVSELETKLQALGLLT